MNRDNGTGWIAEYCDSEGIKRPKWLGFSSLDLPRRIQLAHINDESFYKFEMETMNDPHEWARCVIWVIENLEGGWCASARHMWFESESDAVAFKLGCL